MNESFPIIGGDVPSPAAPTAEQPSPPEAESHRRLREGAGDFLGLAAAGGTVAGETGAGMVCADWQDAQRPTNRREARIRVFMTAVLVGRERNGGG